MKNFLITLLHGGPIDGGKKIIGIGLYIASKALAQAHPELSGPLEELGQFFMIWGVGSDAVKGAEKPKPGDDLKVEKVVLSSPSSPKEP